LTSLRIAAFTILALAAMGALWASLLAAGVQVFPADSFLSYPLTIRRQVFNTLSMSGIAGGVAAAVMVVIRWPGLRIASLGLWIALCGAAILLLAIGGDLLSQQELISADDHSVQLLFWHPVVGAMLDVALACFAVGWGLWLGTALTARWWRAA
jgi:hypothetical protein